MTNTTRTNAAIDTPAGPTGSTVTGAGPDTATTPTPAPTGFQPRRLLRMLPGIVLSFLLPLLVYHLVRSHVDSDAVAFAISGVVPALWTVGRLAVRRRLDPFGAVSVVLFGITVAATALSGGNAVAAELVDPVLVGVFGLVCVGSVLIGRPLNLVILRLIARRGPKADAPVIDAARLRISAVAFGAVGGVLVLRALILTLMATTMSVSGFVAVSGAVGWAVLGIGLAPVFWYRHRARARLDSVGTTSTIGQIWAVGRTGNETN